MKTAIQGVLVALGTPPETTQPRALVHCTEEQIRSVETACMMQPVTIVATAELDQLRRVCSEQASALKWAREVIAEHEEKAIENNDF